MNEFKGTPGPWELDGVEIYPVAGHRASDAICAMQPGFLDTDAALIAAAPDLLNACQQTLEELKKYVLTPHPEGSDGARGFCVKVMRVEAAIAKALGEKP